MFLKNLCKNPSLNKKKFDERKDLKKYKLWTGGRTGKRAQRSSGEKRQNVLHNCIYLMYLFAQTFK